VNRLSGAKCTVKGGLFGGCKELAIALCQYCGRPFCAQHGEILPDDQQVCSRKNCVAKRLDLEQHLVYKEVVAGRNQRRQCGVEGCEFPPIGQCSRCQGYFCADHVAERDDYTYENQIRLPRRSALCQHCHERRPIWTRL
jgi:hypothetical protein